MTLDERDLREALQVAREAAARAGELLREGHGVVRVEHKGPVDLVTEQDRRSEELLVGLLSRRFPGHRVVGEEGGEAHGDGGDAPVWYVDPLDGTTNYAHGLPFYTVCLGLEVGGEPVLGVILAPELGWELWGARGLGAWSGEQRMRVSGTERLTDSLVATGFPHDRRTAADNNVGRLDAVLRRAQGVRRMGCASLDCVLVAWGRLDGYWELKLHAWDISAGALLVREAGGRVTDVDGGPFESLSGRILASNGLVHDELKGALGWKP